MRLYTSRDAARILDMHPHTLRKYARNGVIRTIKTPAGQNRYDVDGYLAEHGSGNIVGSSVVCYARVSSNKQRDDLQRQVEFFQSKYKKAEIIKDIGSGLNFKRKGLNAILERAMRGERITLVVAHRDRLARFGVDLIERILAESGGKLLVLNETSLSPEEEITRDLLSIIHVFSARVHGLRRYKQHIREESKTDQADHDSFPKENVHQVV